MSTTYEPKSPAPAAASAPPQTRERSPVARTSGGYREQAVQLSPRTASDPPSAPAGPTLAEPPRGVDLDATDPTLGAPAPAAPPARVEAPAKDPSPAVTPEADMTGMAGKVALGRFVTAAHDVGTKWSTLTVEQRANAMAKAANDELKTASVPETTPKVLELDVAGQLGLATWTLKLGKKPFAVASPTKAEAADMADTVYHEARHAEQWHRMARVQGGKGKTADELTRTMGIPRRVVDDALTKKLTDAGAQKTEGEAWWESVYGTGRAHRGTTLTQLGPLRVARDQAQAAYEAIKSDAAVSAATKQTALQKWIDAYNAWKTNHNAYMNLPEEADAWKVGGAVTAAYLKK